MNVAELVVKLALDSGKFGTEVKKSQNALEDVAEKERRVGEEATKAGKKMEEAASKGGSAWDGLKGKLMGLLSVTAVISTATAFAEQTKQVEQYSNRVGMSVADWQGWSNAVEEAGGDAQAFGERVVDITQKLTEFAQSGSGALATFAERTGAKFKDAQGNLLSVNDSLLTIAESVEGMSKEQATGVLKGLGFDNNTIDLFLKGRKAVEAYVKAGKEKAVYDKRDIENGAKIRNAYNQLGKTYQLLGARMVGALMPVFEKVGEYAGKAFDFIKENSESIERVFKMLGVAISVALLPKLKQMAVAAWASLGPWTVLIGALTAIGLAIDDLVVWLDGGNSALGEFWSMFGTADEVRETLAGIKDTFFGILESVKPLGPTVLKVVGALAGFVALKRTFTAVASGISVASTALKALFVLMRANPIGLVITALVALASVVASNWDEIKATVLGAWDSITGAVSSALDVIKGIFVAWGNFVRDFWGGIFGWIISAFEAIAGKVSGLINFGKGVVNKVKGWFGGGSDSDAGAGAPALAYAGAGTGTMQEAVASGGFGAPANARPNNVSNDNRKSVKIDQTNNITVQTQATSADGIGDAVGEAMNRNTAAQADVAFGA